MNRPWYDAGWYTERLHAQTEAGAPLVPDDEEKASIARWLGRDPTPEEWRDYVEGWGAAFFSFRDEP